jgi:hypothetical protein
MSVEGSPVGSPRVGGKAASPGDGGATELSGFSSLSPTRSPRGASSPRHSAALAPPTPAKLSMELSLEPELEVGAVQVESSCPP